MEGRYRFCRTLVLTKCSTHFSHLSTEDKRLFIERYVNEIYERSLSLPVEDVPKLPKDIANRALADIEYSAPSTAVTMRQGDEIECSHRAIAPSNGVDNLHLLVSKLCSTLAVSNHAFTKAFELMINRGLNGTVFPCLNRIIKKLGYLFAEATQLVRSKPVY